MLTNREFEMYEQATYELLSNFKERIKMLISQYEALDFHDLKDLIQTILEDEDVELNDAFDENVFNFINDDELAIWLEKEHICRVHQRSEYYVQPIQIEKGEENADS